MDPASQILKAGAPFLRTEDPSDRRGRSSRLATGRALSSGHSGPPVQSPKQPPGAPRLASCAVAPAPASGAGALAGAPCSADRAGLLPQATAVVRKPRGPSAGCDRCARGADTSETRRYFQTAQKTSVEASQRLLPSCCLGLCEHRCALCGCQWPHEHQAMKRESFSSVHRFSTGCPQACPPFGARRSDFRVRRDNGEHGEDAQSSKRTYV